MTPAGSVFNLIINCGAYTPDVSVFLSDYLAADTLTSHRVGIVGAGQEHRHELFRHVIVPKALERGCSLLVVRESDRLFIQEMMRELVPVGELNLVSINPYYAGISTQEEAVDQFKPLLCSIGKTHVIIGYPDQDYYPYDVMDTAVSESIRCYQSTMSEFIEPYTKDDILYLPNEKVPSPVIFFGDLDRYTPDKARGNIFYAAQCRSLGSDAFLHMEAVSAKRNEKTTRYLVANSNLVLAAARTPEKRHVDLHNLRPVFDYLNLPLPKSFENKTSIPGIVTAGDHLGNELRISLKPA